MIEWMITSSALILLIILLRVWIKDRVSPRLRYALWALVLLRLLIPGTLWESRASVMTPVAAGEGYQELERVPRYVRTRPDGWVEIRHQSGYTSIPEENIKDGEPIHYGWPPVESDLDILQRQIGIRDALLAVWLVGAVVAGVFLLVVNLRFSRKLKKSRRTMEQYRGRWVFVMDSLPTPCLFGLFRPAIYLTPELREDEVPHVLAHEYAHFRQGDHVWAALRGVCLALHWYNPLVWLAAYLSRRDCELSCDEGAVRLLGEENRADYGRTLVGLAAGRTTPKELACCATTMTGGKSALKERIALLVKQPKTTAVMACLVAAACLLFAACTFTGAAEEDGPDAPAEPAEPAPENEPPQENSNLPALEDLPTRLFNAPDAYQDPIWLIAELQPEDIAVYYEEETGRSWLRYGKSLQELETGGREPMTPRKLLPELYFQDLDGDGEKELAMIYNSDSGTGVSVWDLLVCEWDGQKWTEYPADTAETVIDDFNASRTLTVSQETGAARVGYLDSAVTVDLNAIYKERGQAWMPNASISCTLDKDNYSYMMHRSGQIFLHINGAVQEEDLPAHEYENNLLYICSVDYLGDGVFAAQDQGLSSGYPYFALTPTFRRILLDYIQERQEAIGEDISADRFAICDVNGDGRDELITQTNAAPLAGQVEQVYDGDGNVLLAEYPLLVYYDNGYATAGWSHNQGAAGDKLWPYTLLKYDENAGKYVSAASVDGWDKSIRDTYLSYDESVIPFPDDVDKDGDGFVYYIIEEEGGYAPVYGEPMDYAEYALWVPSYLGGNAVHPYYFSLSKENIALIR